MKVDKPKIVMIIGSLLRYGGTEKHFLQLAEGLDEHFNFIIFHLNPRTGKAYELLSERTQIYNINYTGSFFGTAKSIINAYQILKKQRPSLIYSSSLIGLILILPFSIIYRVPIISARRSLYSKAVFKWSSWIKKLIFWINNIASTRIIGNSEAVGQLTNKDAFSKKNI